MANPTTWLTITQIMASGAFGECCRNTVRNLIRSGRLPGVQNAQGGRWRVRLEDFVTYLHHTFGPQVHESPMIQDFLNSHGQSQAQQARAAVAPGSRPAQPPVTAGRDLVSED